MPKYHASIVLATTVIAVTVTYMLGIHGLAAVFTAMVLALPAYLAVTLAATVVTIIVKHARKD